MAAHPAPLTSTSSHGVTQRIGTKLLYANDATGLSQIYAVDSAGHRLGQLTFAIWAFHGALDTMVYPYQAEILVRALRARGSKVLRFTLYPGVDHFHSWTGAYADPALWRWPFSQKQSTGNRRQSRRSHG